MLSLSVVEHLDIFEDCGFECLVIRKPYAMDTFILETIEPTLHRGVIPAIAFTAHGTSHAVGLEPVLVRLTGLLTAAI